MTNLPDLEGACLVCLPGSQMEGVLPAGFARHLAPLAGFRNILVHEDLAVDWDQVYRTLHSLEDLERFAELVRCWLAHVAPQDNRAGR